MSPDDLAHRIVRRLSELGQTVATAESLTGGMVVARLVDPPGASRVVRGGIVAYHSDLKTSLVGVDEELLRAGGAVQAEVATQLAAGARARLGADWGVGTTGVAGPDASDGHQVGTVFVAVSGAQQSRCERLRLTGDRMQIRTAAMTAALQELSRSIGMPGGIELPEQVP